MSKALATIVVTLLTAAAAEAVPITIDAAAYAGNWQIPGVTGLVSGDRNLDLTPGGYQIRVAGLGTAAFGFEVAANGDVTSLAPTAATGGAGFLRFETTSIQIDPAAYAGNWWLFGVLGTTSGSQSATVVPGLTYQIRVAGIGTAAFDFEVAANGDVASLDPAAATGSGAILTFESEVIHIDPAAYAGNWWLFGVLGTTSGAQSATVVPGLAYQIRVAGTGLGAFTFDVAANGDVSSRNPDAATGSGSFLTFESTAIQIDPAAYAGDWWLFGVLPIGPGFQTATVVPGVGYQIRVAGTGLGAFNLTVDAAGDVISANTGAAVGAGSLLTFQTASLTIDPGGYAGDWWLFGVLGIVSGARTTTVVPGVGYQVRVAGSGLGAFNVAIAANGDVDSQNDAAAIGGPGRLDLNSSLIQVNPGSFTGLWSIPGVASGLSGPQTISVVPGVSYQVDVSGDRRTFAVAEPCSVAPPSFALAGATFQLDCGAADGDGDGVPDASDNCPLDVNPDQVDQDLDGDGDACDSDLDGDGLDNGVDNCPELINPGQEDLDGDGTGDACDEDGDGDAVPNAIDNCPLVPNTGQADSDGDLIGDACDVDDDNDGVDDATDNCPVDANPDQSDFDANGEGDACDGDVDGDGTANAADLCPSSPLGRPVNADGCTGAQWVALACQPQNFGRHGQYVSCVAHAAQDAVAQGLLAPNEKARFVKEAAKSK